MTGFRVSDEQSDAATRTTLPGTLLRFYLYSYLYSYLYRLAMQYMQYILDSTNLSVLCNSSSLLIAKTTLLAKENHPGQASAQLSTPYSHTHVTVISSLIHLDTLPLRLTNSPRVFTSPPARLFLIRCVAAFSSPSYTQVSLAASPVGAGRSCAGYGRSAPGGGGASGKRLGSADLGSGVWDGWAR